MLGKLKRKQHKKVHGFMSRMSTPGGKKTIARRRARGRQQLTVSDK